MTDQLPFQPRVEHCDVTGKLSYASRHAATGSRGNHRNKGRRMRAYFCNHCRCWHLSSEAFAR